jgi:hypothetical protein
MKRYKQQTIFCNCVLCLPCTVLTLSACFAAARSGTEETIRSTRGVYSGSTGNRIGASIQFQHSTFRRGSSSTRVDTTIVVARFPCPRPSRLKRSELLCSSVSSILHASEWHPWLGLVFSSVLLISESELVYVYFCCRPPTLCYLIKRS